MYFLWQQNHLRFLFSQIIECAQIQQHFVSDGLKFKMPNRVHNQYKNLKIFILNWICWHFTFTWHVNVDKVLCFALFWNVLSWLFDSDLFIECDTVSIVESAKAIIYICFIFFTCLFPPCVPRYFIYFLLFCIRAGVSIK